MFLTEAEQVKFCAYLKDEAESYSQLAEAAKGLPMGDFVTKRYKSLSAAAMIMCNHIGSAESM